MHRRRSSPAHPCTLSYPHPRTAVPTALTSQSTVTRHPPTSVPQVDPSFTTQNEPPNVFANAFTWAVHMGVSSNIRYQALGGLDAGLVKVMPVGLFRLYQVRGEREEGKGGRRRHVRP